VLFTPSARAVTAGYFKLIDGVWHKRCTGPAHDEPTFLPATDKYYLRRKTDVARKGQFLSQCRLCTNWKTIQSSGTSGLVEVSVVRHFYDEAVNRVGLLELSRRTGLSADGLALVLTGKVKHVRKANLRKVMLELISMRRHNEYSANGHARWRTHRRLTRGHQLCSGCGVPQHRYTDGCSPCMWRRYQHTGRGTDLDVVGLNSKVA
jgi:hypothetical protein